MKNTEPWTEEETAGPAADHPAILRARDYGIDISLLLHNLRLTPTERLEEMVNQLQFIDEVRKGYLTANKR